MKTILNRLIQQDTLSKEEAKSILVNISKGEYNTSQIASFLTIFMMRTITIDELSGFKDALLELSFLYLSKNMELLICVALVEMVKTLLIFQH